MHSPPKYPLFILALVICNRYIITYWVMQRKGGDPPLLHSLTVVGTFYDPMQLACYSFQTFFYFQPLYYYFLGSHHYCTLRRLFDHFMILRKVSTIHCRLHFFFQPLCYYVKQKAGDTPTIAHADDCAKCLLFIIDVFICNHLIIAFGSQQCLQNYYYYIVHQGEMIIRQGHTTRRSSFHHQQTRA